MFFFQLQNKLAFFFLFVSRLTCGVAIKGPFVVVVHFPCCLAAFPFLFHCRAATEPFLASFIQETVPEYCAVSSAQLWSSGCGLPLFCYPKVKSRNCLGVLLTGQDGILRGLKYLLLCLAARDFLYLLLPYLRTRFKFRIYILLLPKAAGCIPPSLPASQWSYSRNPLCYSVVKCC